MVVRMCQGTVHIEPPVTGKDALVEDGTVGTQEALHGVFRPTHVIHLWIDTLIQFG